MTPDQYCQNKVPRGCSAYYSYLHLPPERRRALTALQALQHEISAIQYECSEAAVALNKLQWWQDEIQRLYQGTPQHPVSRALLPTLQQQSLEKNLFIEMLNGAQMHWEYNRYPSFENLKVYCQRAGSAHQLLVCKLLGYQNPLTQAYAKHLGVGLQLTRLLRNVRLDAQSGHIYIPLDELTQHGLTEHDLAQTLNNSNTRTLFAAQAARARCHLTTAFAQLPSEDADNQRSGRILAAIQQKLLNEIEKDGYKILLHKIKLTPLRKLWIAWRTT